MRMLSSNYMDDYVLQVFALSVEAFTLYGSLNLYGKRKKAREKGTLYITNEYTISVISSSLCGILDREIYPVNILDFLQTRKTWRNPAADKITALKFQDSPKRLHPLEKISCLYSCSKIARIALQDILHDAISSPFASTVFISLPHLCSSLSFYIRQCNVYTCHHFSFCVTAITTYSQLIKPALFSFPLFFQFLRHPRFKETYIRECPGNIKI